jgi:O-antigen ligase
VLIYSFGITAFTAIIIYFTPSLNESVDKILKKDFPEIYSSRIWMWEPSYKAALEGGLFGLGYGISHPEIRSGEYSDRYENGRLIREKGNSTLALIEEAGLIGLVLFLLPIVFLLKKFRICNAEFIMRPFDRLWVTNSSLLTTNYLLLCSAFFAFILHSQFEAWWVGVGSVQLPLFFIYFGLIVQSSIFSSPKLNSLKFEI